eukprot:gene10973-7618_t
MSISLSRPPSALALALPSHPFYFGLLLFLVLVRDRNKNYDLHRLNNDKQKERREGSIPSMRAKRGASDFFLLLLLLLCEKFFFFLSFSVQRLEVSLF